MGVCTVQHGECSAGKTLQQHKVIFDKFSPAELERMSGPAITKYEMSQGDTKVPPPDNPPSYNATVSGQVDAPFPPKGPPHMQPPPQVITQVQYVAAPMFGPHAVTVQCPRCQKTVTTRIVSEPSSTAWIVGLLLCIIGCVPCCVIPCCMDSMKQVTHSCPSCNTTMGRYDGKGL